MEKNNYYKVGVRIFLNYLGGKTVQLPIDIIIEEKKSENGNDRFFEEISTGLRICQVVSPEEPKYKSKYKIDNIDDWAVLYFPQISDLEYLEEMNKKLGTVIVLTNSDLDDAKHVTPEEIAEYKENRKKVSMKNMIAKCTQADVTVECIPKQLQKKNNLNNF